MWIGWDECVLCGRVLSSMLDVYWVDIGYIAQMWHNYFTSCIVNLHEMKHNAQNLNKPCWTL